MRQKDDKMNFKLHMACGKDELRPAMTNVFVTKQFCVATDAHIMAIVPTTDIFTGEKSMDNIPEEGMYINANDWRKLVTAKFVEYDGEFVIAYFARKSPAHVKPIPIADIGPYPNWKAVIPSSDRFDSVSKIGVNPKFIYNLHQALDMPMFKLDFIAQNVAIAVSMPEFGYGLESGHQFGIVMPSMLPKEDN